MQEVRKSMHNLAVASIYKARAWQARNYDLKHIGTVLYTSDKVIHFHVWPAQRKEDKMAGRGPSQYTILEVYKNGNYTMADATGKFRQPVGASKVKSDIKRDKYYAGICLIYYKS